MAVAKVEMAEYGSLGLLETIMELGEGLESSVRCSRVGVEDGRLLGMVDSLGLRRGLGPDDHVGGREMRRI